MEVTDSNLQSLAGYLEQTLSPDASVRKAGNFTLNEAYIVDILVCKCVLLKRCVIM